MMPLVESRTWRTGGSPCLGDAEFGCDLGNGRSFVSVAEPVRVVDPDVDAALRRHRFDTPAPGPQARHGSDSEDRPGWVTLGSGVAGSVTRHRRYGVGLFAYMDPLRAMVDVVRDRGSW